MSTKKKGTAAEESVKDLTAVLPKSRKRDRAAAKARKEARGARTEQPAKPGRPGSVNDSRRCSATAHRTGERCKAPAIKGHQVCRVHGGAAPQTRRTAKERLLALADPAIDVLNKILHDEDADDSVRLRAALGITDRIGLGPGQTVIVQTSRFDEMLANAIGMNPETGMVQLDRDLPATLGPGGGEPHWEDAHQHGVDAQTEAWREYDAEDEEPYTTRLERHGANVVKGQVVDDNIMFPNLTPTRVDPTELDTHPQGPYQTPLPRDLNDPPRYVDEEVRRAER